MVGLLFNKFRGDKLRVMLEQVLGEMLQCTKPKRLRNSAWFQEKMLLVQAQENGQNAAFQTEDLDAYDSDCDDVSSAKAILMYSEQTLVDDYPDNEITSDSNIIPYSQYSQESQNTGVKDATSSSQ
ncbi:hypothetical protein Tco_0698707 [Tanacetum coccineum]